MVLPDGLPLALQVPAQWMDFDCGATTNIYDPPNGLTTTRTYAVQVDPTGSPDCGVATWSTSLQEVTVLTPLNLGTITSGDETFVVQEVIRLILLFQLLPVWTEHLPISGILKMEM